MKTSKSRKKHAPVGESMRTFRKKDRAKWRITAADLRDRVTIKTFQKGGRVLATIDSVTGKVLKRERNPRYVPRDKEFDKLVKKKKAEQSKG